MAEIGFIHRATLQTNASNIVRPSEDEITLQNVWASLLRIEDSLSRLLGRVGKPEPDNEAHVESTTSSAELAETAAFGDVRSEEEQFDLHGIRELRQRDETPDSE